MPILEFADKKVDGWFPITEPGGPRVAATSRSGFIEQFTSIDGANRPLVLGRKRPLNGWAATDARGFDIVVVQTFGMKEWGVQLPARNLVAILKAPWIGKEWSLATQDGHVLLSSAPHDPSLFHPDSWVVQSDGTLSLAEIVGVVELHRLEVKGGRRTGAAS